VQNGSCFAWPRTTLTIPRTRQKQHIAQHTEGQERDAE
jgi:hypothetical protein